MRTPDEAAAIAADALDEPTLFNARYHLERGDLRWLETIGNHVRQTYPDVKDDELQDLMTAERERREPKQ